jgi:protein-L-isoaspartate(D-aspartate) O-methyltransferase
MLPLLCGYLIRKEVAMSVENIVRLQQNLVESIKPYVQNQNILDAFAAIPRHEFIGDFFEFDEGTKTWERISAHSPGWLEKVYTNVQLVTSINQYNKPNVSSSMPGIMARMIQLLKLKPGERVLEIGTGTGYNAALLSHIVGNTCVTTIDINETLLADAQERLDRIVGPGVTVLFMDGRHLPETLEKFDAIIISASNQSIEPSWIRALNQHGRLILNWNKSFSKVFFELEKQEDGLIGNVASFSGDFMKLHDGNGIAPISFRWDSKAPTLEETDFREELLLNFNFGFFVQIHIPSLIYNRFLSKTRKAYYYAVMDSRGRKVYFSTKISGDATLWREIKEAHEKFVSLGKPRRKELSLKVDAQGAMTFFYQGNEIAVVKTI